MANSAEQIAKWQKALEEKTKQRDTFQNAANKLSSEILQLSGGIQYAAELAENETNDAPATVEVEAEQSDQ